MREAHFSPDKLSPLCGEAARLPGTTGRDVEHQTLSKELRAAEALCIMIHSKGDLDEK
jgi:hypothetical protein